MSGRCFSDTLPYHGLSPPLKPGSKNVFGLVKSQDHDLALIVLLLDIGIIDCHILFLINHLDIFAGIATGNVISPPRPARNPDVEHLASCPLISALAASSIDTAI